MTVLYLPLTNDASYSFNMALENIPVTFKVRWNLMNQAWHMDLSMPDIDLELNGLKLVGGVDLLYPYAITELGQMFVIDLEDKKEDPTRELLGDRFQVAYFTKDDPLVII